MCSNERLPLKMISCLWEQETKINISKWVELPKVPENLDDEALNILNFDGLKLLPLKDLSYSSICTILYVMIA